MMTRYALALMLAATAGWWGCSSPSRVENPHQKLIVQSYLKPGADPTVQVRRTLPPERYYDGFADSVSGADVIITHAGGTYTLDEHADEPGTYSIGHDILPVVPGGDYALTVTAGTEQARARTTVPGQIAITSVSSDTIVYYQYFADLFGDLVHPGEFFWSDVGDAAGHIIIVEAVDVRSLNEWALPLTATLDSTLARRERLEGHVSADSLARLEAQIETLRQFFADNVSIQDASGQERRWLRDRDQEDWDEITERDDWTEGKRWRERLSELEMARLTEYWMPADSLRSDYWWVGVRFEGEYRVRVQAADQNYTDYFNTSQNGLSGNDGDRGPLFRVDNGFGVFGAYTEASFRVYAERGDGASLKVYARCE